ncbi:GNAT family N-acetyltransferase [Massilia sp. TWP1-3-3]|uniref:GNAT family N-acetyltransferase n=1 Tax=Massilia sp. TWP1-3-3 TaxID=2804573 RepID=UPI003CEB82EC
MHAVDAHGATAATGRIVLRAGTAVFDRIGTLAPYRGKGLATALMCALDELAARAGVSERLLVATEAGAGLARRVSLLDGGAGRAVKHLERAGRLTSHISSPSPRHLAPVRCICSRIHGKTRSTRCPIPASS